MNGNYRGAESIRTQTALSYQNIDYALVDPNDDAIDEGRWQRGRRVTYKRGEVSWSGGLVNIY